jgi:helix-hairpin-helix protein
MPQRDDPEPSRSGQSGDDFQKIDGIGPTRAERLRNAGILTYNDLARHSPKEIAAKTGISAELIAKENWIRQARALAGPPPEASVRRQHQSTFHLEFLLDSGNRVRRTKISHHQTPASDDWPEWDAEKLLAFMRTHIPLPPASTSADAAGPEAAEPQVSEQTPRSVPAGPVSRPSPSAPAPERPLSWSLSVEELAPVRGDQRSYTRGPGEPSSARLTVRIDPAGTLSHDTFDYSATIEARTWGATIARPWGPRKGPSGSVTLRVMQNPVYLPVI